MKFLPEILLGILIILQCITTPKLLKRAGLSSSILGFIPVVHYLALLKIIKRPWWWFLLLLVPGVNLIMLVIINVEVGIAFGKRSFAEQWLFGALPWYAFYDLGFKQTQAPYQGPRDWSKIKKSFAREWGEAILFAVVAASIIRTFVLEAFTIPTPSMESSMKVGDYLFVSKLTYGPKLPQTPVSMPFVHNALPGGLTNSYLTWFSLPNLRLPGYGHVERFDPVVFNFPNGDSVIVNPIYVGHDYYNILRQEAIFLADNNYDLYLQNMSKYDNMARENFKNKLICKSCGRSGMRIDGVRWRPLDKKEMYIKRCIGLPGDEIKVVDSQVYINGNAIENKPGMMWDYEVTYSNQNGLKNYIQKNFDKLNGDISFHPTKPNTLVMPLTRDEAEQLKNLSGVVVSIQQDIDTLATDNPHSMYPNSPEAPFNTWTHDQWGPMLIPAKGITIEMNHDNYIRYKRVISAYEGNTIYESNGQVYINGAVASNYTFQDDYYFMMGDNRSHSADSRFWGFVPMTHIVGKAVFTWFSIENMEYHNDNKVRWNRMFRFVN